MSWWGEGASKHHYKWAFFGVSLACQWSPNIECWLDSFVIFRDPDQYCQEILYFCDFSGGCPDPLSSRPHLNLRMKGVQLLEWPKYITYPISQRYHNLYISYRQQHSLNSHIGFFSNMLSTYSWKYWQCSTGFPEWEIVLKSLRDTDILHYGLHLEVEKIDFLEILPIFNFCLEKNKNAYFLTFFHFRFHDNHDFLFLVVFSYIFSLKLL